MMKEQSVVQVHDLDLFSQRRKFSTQRHIGLKRLE